MTLEVGSIVYVQRPAKRWGQTGRVIDVLDTCAFDFPYSVRFHDGYVWAYSDEELREVATDTGEVLDGWEFQPSLEQGECDCDGCIEYPRVTEEHIFYVQFADDEFPVGLSLDEALTLHAALGELL